MPDVVRLMIEDELAALGESTRGTPAPLGPQAR